MRGALRLLAAGAALIALFLALFIHYRSKRSTGPATNIQSAEKRILDDLPIGTPRTRVEAYLTERGIDHSYVRTSTVNPKSGQEVALIRGVSKTWLVRTDIQVLFNFDSQDKLTHCSFKQIYTGP